MVSPSSAFVSPRNGRSKRERRGGEGPGTVAVTLFVAGPESAEKTPLPRGFRENNSLVATRLSSQSFELYKFCFRFTSNFSKRKTKALGILIISHCCAHKPPRKKTHKTIGTVQRNQSHSRMRGNSNSHRIISSFELGV